MKYLALVDLLGDRCRRTAENSAGGTTSRSWALTRGGRKTRGAETHFVGGRIGRAGTAGMKWSAMIEA